MQTMKREGVVQEWDASLGPLAFTSHQWMGGTHPDPMPKQLKVLQQFFVGLRHRNHDISVTWEGIVFSGETTTLSKDKLLKDTERMWIWYDYLCVPQIGVEGDPASAEEQRLSLHLAVLSIPAYIESSSYFFVLCPTMRHDDTQTLIDYHTWAHRAWCRAELTSHLLSSSSAPVVVIRSKTRADIMDASNSVSRFAAVGQGNLTVAADLPVLAKLVQKILAAKLSELREDRSSAAAIFSFRYMLAMRRTFFAGFAEDSICMKSEDTNEAFLQAYDFDLDADPSATDERKFVVDSDAMGGWTPLRFAVMEGNVEVSRELIEKHGARVDVVLAEAEASVGRAAHSTIMHEAVIQNTGRGSTAKILAMLAQHADGRPLITAPDGNGHTPLHLAAKHGNIEAVRWLMNSDEIADLSPRDPTYDNTPYLLACVFSPDPDVVLEFLKAGVPKDQANCFGAIGINKTSMHGNSVTLAVLLEEMPELVNSAKAATTPLGHYLSLSYEVQWHLKERSWAVTLFGQNDTGTGLHDAARMGNSACVQLLLDAGCDVLARGRSGWTAAQLAMDNGHEEILEMIQTHIGEEVDQVEPILVTTARAWPHTCRVMRECFANELPPPLQEKLLTDVKAEEGESATARFDAVLEKISADYKEREVDR